MCILFQYLCRTLWILWFTCVMSIRIIKTDYFILSHTSLVHIRTHAHIRHTHTFMHTHARLHACTHTHTHTHMCKHAFKHRKSSVTLLRTLSSSSPILPSLTDHLSSTLHSRLWISSVLRIRDNCLAPIIRKMELGLLQLPRSWEPTETTRWLTIHFKHIMIIDGVFSVRVCGGGGGRR